MSTLVSGAAMDRPLPPPRGRWTRPVAAALALSALAALAWQQWPRGLPVKLADVDIATAQPGVFHDVLIDRKSVV